MNRAKRDGFWESTFGQEYIQRNLMEVGELDNSYREKYGTPRSKMNDDFLGHLKISRILEVGSGEGNQLLLLKNQGYSNLYGIDINKEAVRVAKKRVAGAKIIKTSALKIPFKDNNFDLVFTSGVLIHIPPRTLEKVMREIYRVSKRYIWGFEYYSPRCQMIIYRGHKNRLWKNDFVQRFVKLFPDLKILKRKKFKYLKDKNIDEMFLLEKA